MNGEILRKSVRRKINRRLAKLRQEEARHVKVVQAPYVPGVCTVDRVEESGRYLISIRASIEAYEDVKRIL